MKFRVRSSFIPYPDQRTGEIAKERDPNGDFVLSFDTQEEAVEYAKQRIGRGDTRTQVISMDVAMVTMPVEVKEIP